MNKQARTVAIIQARMGSTRLPGKVLREIHGSPMLYHVARRALAASTLDTVVIATTTESADEEIVSFCHENALLCFRGSEQDVLDRYYRCAREYAAQMVVRITSDCPLIDPEIIDKTVEAFAFQSSRNQLPENGPPDYASNCIVRTYPRGLDTEVMTFAALERAWLEAREPYQRAHVTPYFYQNPSRFKVLSVVGGSDFSAHRWTVDTPEDLEFVRAVYSHFGDNSFSWNEVLRLLEHHPELSEINSSVLQKALHEG